MIKKYLNVGTIEPQFATPERRSKLDPFAEKLASWLKTKAAKSRKKRRTLKQTHADLVVLGIAPGLSDTVNLSMDDGHDKKQNGKSLLARGPRTSGQDGV